MVRVGGARGGPAARVVIRDDAGAERTVTVFRDHPSFGDVFDLRRGERATFVTARDGRSARDWWAAAEPAAGVRAVLRAAGAGGGAPGDRRRVARLLARLERRFGAADAAARLAAYPYFALSGEREDRLLTLAQADRALAQAPGADTLARRCRGHCHFRVRELCEAAGDTCVPLAAYERALARDFPLQTVRRQIGLLLERGTLRAHEGDVYAADVFRREERVRAFFTGAHEPVPLLARSDTVPPPLSDAQARVFETVAGWRVAALAGRAGTGKTRCIAALACAFENVAFAAPTGKAARRVTEACREFVPGVEAATLHSLLGIGVGAPAGVAGASAALVRNSLLVIDEASMLDLELADAVAAAAQRLNLAVLLVGDPEQLPPVGAGEVFVRFLEWGRAAAGHGPVLELDAALRFETGALARTAQLLGAGLDDAGAAELERLLSATSGGGGVRFVRADSDADAARAAVAELGDPRAEGALRAQVVAPFARLADAVNAAAQAASAPGSKFSAFDRVVCTANASQADLDAFLRARRDLRIPEPGPADAAARALLRRCGRPFEGAAGPRGPELVCVARAARLRRGVNGDCGLLLTPETLIDEGGDLVYVGSARAHAHAITVHKSQGSEWDTAVLLLPPSAAGSAFIDRRLLYTAATRARRELVLVGSAAAAALAAGREAPRRRCMRWV